MESSTWNKGQSSIEIIVALALFIIATTAGFVLFSATLAENEFTRERHRADLLAQEGIEAVRQIRNREWELLTPGTYGLARSGSDWIFSGASDTSDATFTRSVTITNVDENQRDAHVSVSWTERPGRTPIIGLDTRFTNWNDLEVWGDWGIPCVVGSADIGPQGKGTSVTLLDDEVYLTAEMSSGNVPTIFSFDVTPPTSPTQLDAENTTDNLTDIASLDEANVVYTTGVLNDSELRVFDVSDPSVITLLTVRDLEADGTSVIVEDGYLYVGAVNGLHIFDLADPANPVEIGTLNPGTEATDITLAYPYIYLATPDDNKEIIIVDASDRETPVEVGSYNTSTAIDGLSIAARKSRLYLGTFNQSSGSPELFVFNRTNPTSPVLLYTTDVGGDINDMIAAGNLLFMSSGISNGEFVIYDIISSPTIEAQLNMSNIAKGLDFVDNTIYISLRSNDAFQIAAPCN